MIIGFCGPAGSGKSFAAAVLRREHGFMRLRFAGPLKAMLRALGLTEADVDGDGKERPHPRLCGRTPREAMQTLGTEWGRTLIGPDIWIEMLLEDARWAVSVGQNVVIDDVRNANEVSAIHHLGGRVLRIRRPGVEAKGAHVSERSDFTPDGELVNDGEGFAARVAGLV